MTLITNYTPDTLAQPAQPRPYELGRVVPEQGIVLTAAELQIPDTLAPAEIIQPVVVDGYVERLDARKPGRVADIQAMESEMDAYAGARRRAGAWQNEPNTPYLNVNGTQERKRGWGDPRSKERFMGPGGILDDEAIRVWASGIPAATALLPLADPENVQVTFGRINREFVAAEATDETREWMTACTDGWEIRNRGAILAEEFRGIINDHAAEHPDEQITMVSVAAGTLLPTLQAAVNSGQDHRIRIVMLEHDPMSIAMAEQLVDDLGFRGELDIRDVDVFDPKQMNEQLEELEGTALTVDAVGIFEYVNEAMRAKLESLKGKDYMLYDPVAFFQTIQRFAQVGGQTVIGQMRSDRPNGDFTRGVIGWPYIVERTPAEVAGITVEGGASPKNTKMILTPKGVYTMLSIRKTEVVTRPWTDRDSARAVGGTGLDAVMNGNGHHGNGKHLNGAGARMPVKLRPSAPGPDVIDGPILNTDAVRVERPRREGPGRVLRALRAAQAVLASVVF